MKNDLPTEVAQSEGEPVNESRRAFLNTYGKAALVAPPVITTLLATSMSSPAIAATTGGNTGRGGGVGPLALLAGAPIGLAATARQPQAVAAQTLPTREPAAPLPPAEVQMPPPPTGPYYPGPERG